MGFIREESQSEALSFLKIYSFYFNNSILILIKTDAFKICFSKRN
jgi:hypothetical protein